MHSKWWTRTRLIGVAVGSLTFAAVAADQDAPKVEGTPSATAKVETVKAEAATVDPLAEETIKALDVEIRKLQDELVPGSEIKRAVKQARAVFAYSSENITNQAFWMGYAEIFASYDWFVNYLDNLAKVTPKDVQRVAREYFQPNRRVIGTYIPKEVEA